MISTSMDSLTDEYKLLNSQPPSDTNALLMNNSGSTALYNNNNNNNNNNGIIIDNAAISVVPDLLAENSQSNNSASEPSSAEEAVFLPTYATLPTTKLEEEPNPFEQSFEATAKISEQQQQQQKIPVLPSVNAINNPKLDRLNVMENQWDSLRSGILSPSMLQGPATLSTTTSTTAAPPPPPLPQQQPVMRRPVKYEVNTNTTTFYNHTYENPPPTVNRNHVKHTRKFSNSSESSSVIVTNNKRQRTNNKKSMNSKESSLDPEDEEKRKNFLERNRIAALKCRQRKKQWLQNLQTKVEYLAADNEQFHMQANALREELINLKTLLMAHKDCPINQQELKVALNRPIPGVPNLPHLLATSMIDENDSNN